LPDRAAEVLKTGWAGTTECGEGVGGAVEIPKALENAPDYTTAYRRIGCKRIKITGSMASLDGKTLTVGPIPDGTGLEPTHRGNDSGPSGIWCGG